MPLAPPGRDSLLYGELRSATAVSIRSDELARPPPPPSDLKRAALLALQVSWRQLENSELHVGTN